MWLRAPCASGCQCGADDSRIGVELEEDPDRGAVLLANQREQDVLGADLRLIADRGFAPRPLDHILRPAGEGQLFARRLDTEPHHPDHLPADGFAGDARGLQDAGRRALVLTQEREQDVLGPDEAVPKLARLLAGKAQRFASAICELLVQSDVRCLSMVARTDLRLAWRRS